MVRPARRLQPNRYEKIFSIPDVTGINTHGPHSRLAPKDMRTCANLDLFPGYRKSRRGSAALQTTLQKFGNKDILTGAIWDRGSIEYIIVQCLNALGTGTEFFVAQVYPTPGAWSQIQTLAGVNLTTSSALEADLLLSGERLLVFHPTGNLVIQWDATSSTFKGRTMGMPAAKLTSLASSGAGSLTGKYTYGVELVYQVNGVDVVNSSPWRKTSAGALIEVTLSSQNCNVTVNSATLPTPGSAGDFYTHVRLWRSKNRNVDNTDPLNPVDAAGLASELYPVKLVTKAALIAAAYIINDSTTDAALPGDTTSDYPVVNVDTIELSPLPPAYIGTYHRDRIWISQAQGVDDTSQSNLYYSNSAGDAYAEQYDPLNVMRAQPGDGQKTVKLISFERDLVVLKESKTARVQDGNPEIGCELLDPNIGITSSRFATFVPGLGVCAVTNDAGEFKVLGFDMRWTSLFNGIDIGRAIREQTSALTADDTSLIYVNGKLMLSDGTGTVYVLHVKEARGWSTYSYPMNSVAQLFLTFQNGTRALVASKNTYLIEIEKTGATTDINTFSDESQSIECSYTTSRFQSQEGRDVLEMRYCSQMAELSSVLRAVPYVNGSLWPLVTRESKTAFVVDTAAYSANSPQLEREYRLYLEEKAIGNFLHFRIYTSAPCTLHDLQLRAFVDEAQMGAGRFDPYTEIDDAAATPNWLELIILNAGFGARAVSSFNSYDAGNGARTVSSMDAYDRVT